MEALNKLAKAQQELGHELNRVLTNLKKDSPSRRTKQYLDERQSKIEKIWSKVEYNHAQIEINKNEDHPYYKTNYCQQIEEIKSEALKFIDEQRYKLSSGSAEEIDEQDHLVEKLLREQRIRAAELSDLIDEAKTEILRSSATIYTYERYHKEIEKCWKTFNNNMMLKINITDILHPYFQENTFQRLRKLYGATTKNLSEKIYLASRAQSTQASTKLPEIKIPFFSGQYEEWTTFQDIFKRVIDSNKNLSQIEKMQYLKTYVKGEASKTILHFICLKTTQQLEII